MPRIRRPLLSAVTAVIAVVAIAGCKDPGKSSLPQPSRAFCDAAVKYDDSIQKTTTRDQAEMARAQLPLVQRMADTAPADIRAAAHAFADALRRRAGGDTSVVNNAKVKKAVDDVNRRAGNGCGFYKSQNGGGGI